MNSIYKERHLKKLLISVCLLFMSTSSFAAYTSAKTPIKLYGADFFYFGIEENAPSDTCDHHSRKFKLDVTENKGKNMLSLLLAAKLANKKIDIWYTASTTPGTNKDTGCTQSTMAEVFYIGIQ